MSVDDETTLLDAIGSDASVVLFNRRATINLSGTIHVTRDLTLRANHDAVLSGQGKVRLFEVSPGVTLTLLGLTVTGGFSTNGGAIYTDGGNITAIDCTFSNNIARGVDGVSGGQGTYGIPGSNLVATVPGGAGESGSSGTAARGGAIFCRGTLIVSNTLFIQNTAQGGAGGSGGAGGDGPTYVQPGDGGDAGNGADAEGGAVYVEGAAQFSLAHFVSNMALSGSGGLGGQPGTNVDRVYSRRRAGASGASGAARGGAAALLGEFYFAGCQFRENSAQGCAGTLGVPVIEGIRSYEIGGDGRDGSRGGDAQGGAIYAIPKLAVNSSLFAGNSAIAGEGGAGGAGVNAQSWGYSVDAGKGGRAGDGGIAFGGAICSMDQVSISNSLFRDSMARAGDGGMGGRGGIAALPYGRIPNPGKGGDSGACSGGAIHHAGSLRLERSRFESNASMAGRGGIGGVIGGVGNSRFFSAGPWGRSGECVPAVGGALASDGTNALARCQFIANIAFGANGTNGGSYSTPKIDPARGQDGNAGGSAIGGAAFLSGVTDVDASTIASNQCVAGDAGSGGYGGSSLYDNAPGGSGGFGGDSLGAGIFASGTFHAVNCTIAFNSETAGLGGDGKIGGTAIIDFTHGLSGDGGNGGSAKGAGLFLASNSTARIEFCTFAGNTGTNGAPGMGGHAPGFSDGMDGIAGAYEGSAAATLGGQLFFRNSIVANAGSSATAGVVEDLEGNICSDGSCGFNRWLSQQNRDPLLDALQDNGGPTLTMALLPGSPAIDAALSPCALNDQRGFARSTGTSCDIGAFEFNAVPESRHRRIVGAVRSHGNGMGGVCVLVGNEIVFTDESGRFESRSSEREVSLVRPLAPSSRFLPRRRIVNLRNTRSVEVSFRALR